MDVTVVFLSDFFHGRLNAVAGRSQPLEKGLAEDLERAGLLRIVTTPVARAAGPAARLEAGKAPDGGGGQPSSVSLPAPALQSKTLSVSDGGGAKIRKAGA